MGRLFLLPADGSDEARDAEEILHDLADAGDEVIVLNVMPDMPAENVVAKYDPIDFNEEFSKESLDILNAVSNRLREEGLTVETRKTKGSPGEVVCDLAENLDADYVVMGRRGRGAASELLLGSVSRHVIHNADAPVLVS